MKLNQDSLVPSWGNGVVTVVATITLGAVLMIPLSVVAFIVLPLGIVALPFILGAFAYGAA